MKHKYSQQNDFDPKEPFEIKNPIWSFWVCMLAAIGCLTTFFVFAFLKKQNIITADIFYVGYIFLALSVVSGVGIYVCIVEKLTYSNGAYKYYRPFGKKQHARAEDVSSVKVLIFHYHVKYGGIRSKIRVFFYNKNEDVLIKIVDDGTLIKNKRFLRSLKYNRIKIIHEEKYDY